MLTWLWIALGILIAWVLVAWLDQRALREMRREHAQEFPRSCFECGLYRQMNRPVPPHDCRPSGERRDVIPAGGSEVASVEEP